MSSAQPEISVIISTYNDRDLVPKKLAEIEGQTYFSRAEFIFVEPNSPGNERELLEPFCEKHENCRLIARGDRINLYQAWNLGWEAAKAPYVCVSNMDDSMHSRLLEMISRAMVQNEWDVGTVLIAKQPIDDSFNDWSPSRVRTLELSKRPGPFFVWRKDLLPTFGKFDENLEIVGDKDFWARAHFEKLKIGLLPFVGYLNTFHSKQLSKSGDASSKKRVERELCAKKAYPHVWPTSLCQRIRIVRCLRRLPIFGRQYFLPAN